MKILIDKNSKNFQKNFSKHFFVYQKYYFVAYWYNNNPFFDIQHTISVLNLKSSYEKYNEFSKNIQYSILYQNKYGGYFLRELIGEKTMYNLIMSSNSLFSTKFKNDVSEITKNKIELKKNDKSKILSKNTDVDNDNILKCSIEIIHCSYKNFKDILYAQHLVKRGSKIILAPYLRNPLLYAFLMPFRTKFIIIKYGFSDDIIERMASLKKEFKVNIYLVGLRLVKSQLMERDFHRMLKGSYSESIFIYI